MSPRTAPAPRRRPAIPRRRGLHRHRHRRLRAAAALILPFLIAVFLAVVNVPLMNWLVRLRVPKPLAVLLTVLTVASVIGILVALLAQSVNQLTEVIPRYRARVGELGTSVTAWGAALGLPVEAWREEWQSVSLAAFGTGDTIGAIIGNTGAIVGNAVRAVGAFLSNAFLVFLTVVFILFEAAGFTTKIKLAFGAGPDPFGHLGRISAQIQTYLVTKAAVSAATGSIVGIWVAIMGLDFPLLWGVVAFMFNFIPTLGSIFAAIPAVLLALLQLGPGPRPDHRGGVPVRERRVREPDRAGAARPAPRAVDPGGLRVPRLLGLGLGAGRDALLGAAHDGRQDRPREHRRSALAGRDAGRQPGRVGAQGESRQLIRPLLERRAGLRLYVAGAARDDRCLIRRAFNASRCST